jgi:hypothetical protein
MKLLVVAVTKLDGYCDPICNAEEFDFDGSDCNCDAAWVGDQYCDQAWTLKNMSGTEEIVRSVRNGG